MTVIVTGAKGQLGYEVVSLLKNNGVTCIGIDKDDCDLTNKDKVQKFIMPYKPDIIVHCAAYTAVDNAEENENIAYDINVNGTKYLLECAKKIGSKFIFISTDYVFDGTKETPYEIYDTPKPINVYGKTKLLGEEKCLTYDKSFVVRTSWVFGVNSQNFVKTILRLCLTKTELTVVNDQFGSPTYAYDLAQFLVQLMFTDKYGIYHATNDGFCSWYDFACEIVRVFNKDCRVIPIGSDKFVTKAKRPSNSRLSKNSIVKAKLNILPSWKDALIRYKEELIEKGELL